jgi:hypothetical protein
VKAPAYMVKALDETTWQAFAALVEHNNGIFGGCWCMGFHPKEADQGPVTAALNRERKLNRVRAGTAHAALPHHCHDPGSGYGVLCHQPAVCRAMKRLSFPVSGFRCR